MLVEYEYQFFELWDEEERDDGCANQIEHEDIDRLRLSQHKEIEEVESDVEEYEQEFEGRELVRPLLDPQQSERNSLDGVEGNHCGHHHDVFFVVAISQYVAQW